MLISLRSHLIAGTAAAMSAGVVVAAAPGVPVSMHAQSAAQVTLAALSNPFDQLIATAQMAQNYLFGNYYNGGDAPTPGAGEANWTAAGFDQTGGDVLNFLLYNEIPLGYYSTVGLLPQGVINAGPVAQQLQLNLFEYINVGLSALNGALTAISSGVWNYPSALATAAQLALQGQIPQALAVLGDAIITPIVTATESLIGAGTYIVSSFVAKTIAVFAALPQVLTTFAGTAAGGAIYLTETSVSIATNWLTSLASFDLEGAWNVAVNGLLGPSGLPGAVLNLTTGSGVQTGPIQNPATDIPGNFVPSVRTSYQAGLWTIAEALAVEPAPMAATSPSEARAAAGAQAVPAGSAAEAAEPAVAGDQAADAQSAPIPSTDSEAVADARATVASPKAAAQQSREKRVAAR